MQIPEWLKPGVWGAVIGAAGIAIIGFSAGWVVTSGAAQEQAEMQAEKAVLASLTPVCVAQFRSETQQAQTTHLAALQKEDYWERGDYIEQQGWATLPGSKTSNDEVAEACSTALLDLAKKQS